jgi:hypothetical protein
MCSPRYLISSAWGSCTLFIWIGDHVSLLVVNVRWIDLDPECCINISSIVGHERASNNWCNFVLFVFLHIDSNVF